MGEHILGTGTRMRNPFERMTPQSIRTVYSIAVLAVLAIVLVHAFDVMVFKATSNDQCAWLPSSCLDSAFLLSVTSSS